MRVLLFAQAKVAAGTPELEMSIPGGSGSDVVWQALVKLRPALAPFSTSTRLARNGEYTDDKTIFNNADEVALIPPVSGG